MITRKDIINEIKQLTDDKIHFFSRSKGYDVYLKSELFELRDWLLKNLDMKKVIVNKM